jgi:primary-amine oxidase
MLRKVGASQRACSVGEACPLILAIMAFALVATNGPLTAQLSPAARSKPLAIPAPGPDAGSLKWLLGKPEGDAAKEEGGPKASCSLQQCDASVYCFPGTNSACLIQTFPDIQWRICIQASAYGTATNQHSRGISIGPVDIRRNLAVGTPWQRVIYRAEVAENATPYHDGEHLSDDQYADWSNWRKTVTAADANGGALITLAKDASFGPSIVGECRDQGPGWLCKGKRGSFVRRSRELVLWGIYDAGNYDYIQEFGFHDDGTISLRNGATGYLNPERPEVAHLHDSLWRIDLDINGAGGDSAFLTRHVEPVPGDPSGKNAEDVMTPFNGGVEGAEDWHPEEFNTLVVQDAALNATGRPMGYELEPLRTGTPRHFGATEKWTQHDFWVTRLRTSEDTSWAATPVFTGPDGFLLPYVSDHQSIMNGDVVVWYLAAAHHEPISEDLDNNQKPAVTLVHWYGLDLKPHDFFDLNPLGGGPLICD